MHRRDAARGPPDADVQAESVPGAAGPVPAPADLRHAGERRPERHESGGLAVTQHSQEAKRVTHVTLIISL